MNMQLFESYFERAPAIDERTVVVESGGKPSLSSWLFGQKRLLHCYGKQNSCFQTLYVLIYAFWLLLTRFCRDWKFKTEVYLRESRLIGTQDFVSIIQAVIYDKTFWCFMYIK